MAMDTKSVDCSEAGAASLDERDPLKKYRDRFLIPEAIGGCGEASVYLAGNSLGCQPRGVGALIEQELEDWAKLGVEAHVRGRDPWLSYHEQFREPLGRLVGALPHEIVAMNTLTVNLHLLMVSFYRPTAARHKILIEDGAFPSDSYAVKSQIRFHGLEVGKSLIRVKPRDGEETIRTDDIEALLEQEGDSIALVMLPGVNYLTGELFDIERITGAARAKGCVVGWDLAHAVGNVPLRLHDCGADFAVWCSYKYLNGGPGAIAGAFVHERHAGAKLPRLEGWWGNDPENRFEMRADFRARGDVDAWQLSNPPIFSMVPLKASLAVFDEAGVEAVREKSVGLTGYMERLLGERCSDRVRVVTPRDSERRGAQLSLAIDGNARVVSERLAEKGVVADFREPNILRAAPAPLYVSYRDVWRFVDVLAGLV